MPGLAEAQPLDGRPGLGRGELREARASAAAQEQVSEAVRALADADVPLLAFELEGARLSDAFLAMTGEG